MSTWSGWTETEQTTLATLWAGGASAGQIARQMLGRTRCSVLGRLFRQGMLADASNRPTKLPVYRPRPIWMIPKPGERRTRRKAESKAEKLPPLPLAMPSDSVPLEQRKSLFELSDDHGRDLGFCRFPYGEPCDADFFFCGAPGCDVTDGRPYCRFHTRLTTATRAAA